MWHRCHACRASRWQRAEWNQKAISSRQCSFHKTRNRVGFRNSSLPTQHHSSSLPCQPGSPSPVERTGLPANDVAVENLELASSFDASWWVSNSNHLFVDTCPPIPFYRERLADTEASTFPEFANETSSLLLNRAPPGIFFTHHFQFGPDSYEQNA